MDRNKIIKKFGDHYIVDDYSYIMGIDIRFANHLALRFKNKIVLETCTGAGFTTISLAKYAKHVYSVEIDGSRLEKAKQNSKIAGLENKITFINGDITAKITLDLIPEINAAFIDSDWAVKGDYHTYRFINSNTNPQSDKLLNLISEKTKNITLIQPPHIDRAEFKELPPHECEYLFLNNHHELYALHFGELERIIGESNFEIKDN